MTRDDAAVVAHSLSEAVDRLRHVRDWLPDPESQAVEAALELIGPLDAECDRLADGAAA